ALPLISKFTQGERRRGGGRQVDLRHRMDVRESEQVRQVIHRSQAGGVLAADNQVDVLRLLSQSGAEVSQEPKRADRPLERDPRRKHRSALAEKVLAAASGEPDLGDEGDADRGIESGKEDEPRQQTNVAEVAARNAGLGVAILIQQTEIVALGEVRRKIRGELDSRMQLIRAEQMKIDSIGDDIAQLLVLHDESQDADVPIE